MKKFLMMLILFLFLGTIPAFADGGIPLWIYTAHTAFGITSMGEPFITGLIWTLIVLAIVIIIEFTVAECIFRFKEWKRVFKTVLLGNIITTIIGTIITVAIYPIARNYSHGIDILIIGPYGMLLNGYGLVIGNILLFLMSFLIEYYIAKIRLEDIFEIKKIKIAFLSANIVSYFLPLIATIIAILGGIGEDNFGDNIPYFTVSLIVLIGTIIFIYLFIKKDSTKTDISNNDKI